MNPGTLLACADPREGELVSATGRDRLAVLGVGKAAAAGRLATAIATWSPRLVLLFGICGAYPARHAKASPVLEVLDLCVVAESVLADEGVETPEGFLDLARMGLGSCGPIGADGARSQTLAGQLGVPAVRAATVSTCSGTEALSAELARRSGAQVETMESAACAFVCEELGVPMVELRCVSNRTGARDAAGFAIRAAAERVQGAVLEVIEAGGLGA